MFRRMIVLIALSALPTPVPAQEAGRVHIPVIAMEDQFETAHDVKQHRGDVLVLIYGDQASARANQALGEQVHVYFHPSAKGLSPVEARKAPVKPVDGAPEGARSPDVKAIPVACVGGGDSKVARLTIRALIRANAPKVPIWLDFHDQMKTQYPYKKGVPNVIVLDTQGRYHFAAAGQPTEAGIKRLLDVIGALRREAVEK